MKNMPIFSNEIMVFKSLITIHRVLCGGHSSVLRESLAERSFFDNCLRSPSHEYSQLISLYIQYLKFKLRIHEEHPEFTGSFDYNEYMSMKKSENANEG
jgi:hypothetical protein